MKFNIQIPDGHGVPNHIIEECQMVMDDTHATYREKRFAWMLMNVSCCMNKLVEQLNFGTATVVVEEPGGVHYVKKLD